MYIRWLSVFRLVLVPALSFFSLLPQNVFSQNFTDQMDDSMALVFDNSGFPNSFRQRFKDALNHYPELKHTHIRIRLANISTTMQARPHIFTFMRKKENREYYLTVDTMDEKSNGLFFRLSDSARFGLIGHELAHILDYHHHHILGIAGRGFQFLFNRSGLEHHTDKLAVQYGFRKYLQKYAEASFDPEVAGINYARKKRKYYYDSRQLAIVNPDPR